MNNDVNDKLLAKYVAGECSERERALVQRSMAQDTAASDRVARLQRIWDAAETPSSQWDTEAAWAQLSERVREEDETSPAVPADHPQDRPAKSSHQRTARSDRRHSGPRMVLRTAAVVAVVVVGVLVARLFVEPTPFGAEAKVFTAKKGQQATVRLTDGTKVKLNADSRITIPAEFKSGRREVRLEGEAYFDVARDTTRPFVVRARETTVQVLGTAFDVQAYAGEQETHVAVAEGSVAMRTGDAQEGDTTVVLRPRFLATVSEQGLEAVREDVDLSRKLAWTEGRLVFDDTPFDKVARKLERRYDVQV
jgi:transmembrane sensor